MLFKQPAHFTPKFDITGIITRKCADWVEHRGRLTLIFFTMITLLSGYGISQLTVENRFIDYFKPTTEIYQAWN